MKKMLYMPYGLLAVIMTLNIWYKNLQFQYEIIGFVFFAGLKQEKRWKTN